MITVTGTIVGLYATKGGENSKGETYESKSRCQLLTADSRAANGVRSNLVDVTLENGVSDLTEGQKVQIPVSLYARGSQIYYKQAGDVIG